MKRLITLISTVLLSVGVTAQDNWQQVTEKAKGQTVYFHAWGGSQEINNYLRWADKQLQSQYGVTLNHVKVTDIAETTTRFVEGKLTDFDIVNRVEQFARLVVHAHLPQTRAGIVVRHRAGERRIDRCDAPNIGEK